MEFRFRAVDDRPPPPPIFNSFSEQPLLGQHFPPPPNFTPSPRPNFPSGFPVGDFRPYPGPIRHPNEVRGLALLELERERLRDEIILAEIARRRELEMEVRREIMLLEREIGMRREINTEGFLFFDEQRAAMRYSSPRLPMVDSFGEHLGFSSRAAAFDAFPLARPPADDIALKLNTPPETDKDKLIVLAKPDPNLFETKRKAVTPPALDTHELHPFGFKKKPQEEWSCALCQVTATSEKGLNQHLRGRKHKAREAGLVSQKVGKSPITSRKKTGNPSKATETVGAANSKLGAEVEGKPLEQNQTANTLNKKKQGLKRKLKQLIREEQNAGELNMTSGSETVKTADGTAEQEMMKAAKKYRFWCETCQVGSQSLKVMVDHKGGKKHMARLRCEPSKSSVADLISTNTPSEALFEKPTYSTVGNKAIVEKPKDSNLEDQGNEKTTTDDVADADKSTPVEKPKDSNVENQANDKTTYDVSNTDESAPVDKPKDSNEENQASEKTTGDVSSTDNPTPSPSPSPSPSPEA